MISERSFASSFLGFWTELLPMLTPSFIHMINEGYKKRLADECGEPIKDVTKNLKTGSFSLIAEFAFFLAKTSIEEKLSVEKVFNNKKYCEFAERSALDEITKYEGRKVSFRSRLVLPELREGLALAKNYQRFFEARGKDKRIEFAPIIQGAGFLSICQADISIEDALFEIKTVDRNLAGKDIRQLLIYLALQEATGKKRWLMGGFFNPRKAIYHEFEVDEIIPRMSGKSSSEVFQDIIDFVCTRDIQIDMVF